MAMLEDAIREIKAGNKRRGKEILAAILEHDRNNEQVWLWLTQTDISREQKIKSLQNVLKINPNNEVAKEGLAKMSELKFDTKQCPYCAEIIKSEAQICRFCNRDLATGVQTAQQPQQIIIQQPDPPVQKASKNRSLAILLALFLGGIGIHKFYLNKPGAGVLYVLFCWTLIPLIISVLEGIGYLLMSDEDFQKKYR